MSGNGQESGTEGLDAQRKETNNQDVIRKLKKRLLPGFRITLLLSLVIYLAMFIVGVLGVKRCPVNENIPLFLCMTGFVGLASKIVTYLRDRIIPYFKIKYMESALYTTELIFFILGTYWVFKTYKPSFNPADGSKYCQKTAFMFAFIYLAAFYGFVLLIILLALCACCCACMGMGILNRLIDQEIKKDAAAENAMNAEENVEQQK